METMDRDVTLTFEHTVAEGVKATATVPRGDATPDWVLEVFLKFNKEFPEAIRHTGEAITMAQRLYDGAA